MFKHTSMVACLLGWALAASSHAVAQTPVPAAPEAGSGKPAPEAAKGAAPASRRMAAASRVPVKPWGGKRFVYKADGKRLSDLLHDFASSQGLPAVVGEGIDGMVQANFNSSPEEFLNAMAKAYGVLWYHDGTALYFYQAKSIQSRLFRVKGFSKPQVEELLESLGIGDRRYPLRFNSHENTLLVYGPPRHIDLVAAALDSLDAGVMERNRRVVRVFPLRFASAGDRRFGQSTVPGLAATMRSIYAAQGGAAEPKAAAPNNATAPAANKMRAMSAMYGANPQAADLDRRSADATTALPPEKSTMGIAQRGMRSPVEEDDDTPVFQADEETNAIIVRGKLDRMSDYAAVIQRLDVRPTLVEIEAMIIDVSSDSIETLGIAWSASGGKGSFSVTPPANSAANVSGGANVGTFSISTLWANSGRELLTRIDALQSNGKARIVAKPKVLGIANRPAIMKENRVVSVRVAGNLDANLFTLEAGTQLQVTPQVVTSGDSTRIKLSLFIIDGNFEEGTVDNVPIVKHTEIVTEAHVTEGESLLIGGITVDSNNSRTSGVPLLSKIPGVGGLFRWKSDKSSRSERLFLITPRLIRDVNSLPPSTAPVPAPAPALAPALAPIPAPAPVTPAAPGKGFFTEPSSH